MVTPEISTSAEADLSACPYVRRGGSRDLTSHSAFAILNSAFTRVVGRVQPVPAAERRSVAPWRESHSAD